MGKSEQENTNGAIPEDSAPRIGLALGSGAARGWSHIGVIESLARAGIHPHIICGTSIGALVGAASLAGRMDGLRDWALNMSRGSMLRLLDFRMRGGGVVGGERIVGQLQSFIPDCTIAELPAPYGAVATGLYSGNEMWLVEGPLISAVRASISIPGIFTPVRHNGVWLVDGGVVNPVPVNLCRALGAQIVIAVNPNSVRGGRLVRPERQLLNKARPMGEQTYALNGTEEEAANGGEGGADTSAEKTPGILEVMANSINIMQERIIRGRMAGDPPDALLNPRAGHIGLLEFHRAAEAIEAGEAAVRVMLPVLEEVLERQP